MSSPAPDRGFLSALIDILLYPFRALYRLLLRLFGLGADPIVILAPRTGDHVKKTFTVEGTIGNSTPVSVTLTGDVTGGPGPSNTPQPRYYDWYVTFVVNATGACTATATASGASPKSVDFVVDASPLVELDPPGLEQDPPTPLPGEAVAAVAAAATNSGYVKIKGKCPDAAYIRSLDAYLELSDAAHTQLESLNLKPNAAGKKFNDKFRTRVNDGVYVVHVVLVHTDGTKVETTRIVVTR